MVISHHWALRCGFPSSEREISSLNLPVSSSESRMFASRVPNIIFLNGFWGGHRFKCTQKPSRKCQLWQTIGSVGDCDKLESRALCGPNQTFKKYHVGQANLICESSKTSGPSVYQSLGTSQKGMSNFHPSPCSMAPLRPHDGLLKWRKGRGGDVHWKTGCRLISSNIIHPQKKLSSYIHIWLR